RVEVRAAEGRRALDELEAIREEDADQRAVRGVEQPLGRRAVDLEALDLPWLETDAELVLAIAVAPMDLHAHDAGGRAVILREAQQLALVGRPARASRAAEVQRLEQVRLARAIGTVNDREPLAQRHLDG